jgi:diguanylate cyclase
MKNDNDQNLRRLKEATLECKALIESLEIVTPAIYAELFAQVAKKYGLEEGYEEASFEALKREVAHLLELNERSAKQIDSLDNTSKKALEAMREQDSQKLQESIDETELLRREIAKLKESVYTDPLTKVWNRQWLNAHLLDEKEAFLSDYVVAIVDLNYFKQINDTLGHIAGDKVLQFIANHLKQTRVPVVRYGGDEFLLFFDSRLGERGAFQKMKANRDDLLAKTLKFGGQTFKASFSYGVAEAKKGAFFTQVLERADKYLYRDKQRIKQEVSPPF